MATSAQYKDYVMEQLAGDVHCRAMMGEYVLYYRGRVFGGIYDNRLLVKPVSATLSRMPGAKRELPYEGGKEMLLVEQLEDRTFLAELLEAMYPELPEPKRRKGKRE